MEVPVVADVGVTVSLLNVLAVGEVTVVGVVVLFNAHTPRAVFRINHCSLFEMHGHLSINFPAAVIFLI